MTNHDLIKTLWDKAVEAASPEIANAYMISLLYVYDYIADTKGYIYYDTTDEKFFKKFGQGFEKDDK